MPATATGGVPPNRARSYSPSGRSEYDARSINILSEREKVRKNQGFYIGGRGQDALTRMIKEPIDNCVDEALAGRNDLVGVLIDTKRCTATVFDNGRGIPVDAHPQTKRSVLIDIFTLLHAGGKTRGASVYTKSVGVHGVGITVVNFLSKSVDVWSNRKTWWYLGFSEGKPKSKAPIHQQPPVIPGHKPTGTIVRFQPDLSCFTAKTFDVKWVRDYLELLSYLVPQVDFCLSVDGKQEKFRQKNGILDYTAKIKADNGVEDSLGKPFVMECEAFNLALEWTTHSEELFVSYVNGSATTDGGEHVKALQKAITDAFAPYKTTRTTFDGQDLRTGLVGVLNVYIQSPEFDSQTKSKLKSAEAYGAVYDNLLPKLKAFLAFNKTMARSICSRASEMKDLRASFAASKKAISEIKSKKSKQAISAKFAGWQTSDVSKRELFVVEGDSAKGTGKSARDSNFQGVMPIRGKIINAYGTKANTLMENKEVQSILAILGYDGKPDFKPQCGRVIFLTDADDDGYHIAALLTSLWQRVMPQMFARGMVYTVDAPLYITNYKGRKLYGKTLKEIYDQAGKKIDGVTRLKGWGEAPAEDLKRIAFDFATRKLIQLRPLEGPAEVRQFVETVGVEYGTGARKELLGI